MVRQRTKHVRRHLNSELFVLRGFFVSSHFPRRESFLCECECEPIFWVHFSSIHTRVNAIMLSLEEKLSIGVMIGGHIYEARRPIHTSEFNSNIHVDV